MNHKKMIFNRKGVALIVVLLIIIAVTGIALIALKTSQYDDRTTMAFLYSRQGQHAAHQVGLFMEYDLAEHAQDIFLEKEGIIREDRITPFSGLNTDAPADNAMDRLKGDLSREILQMGTAGDLSLINKPVSGFSKGDAYCSYIAHANSYAVIGRVPQVHEGGYYLLSELNAQIVSYKREMGAMNVEPLTCNQPETQTE